MRFLSNERGISLVEVVASLVIITVIFLSFFGLFIQSKKTNVSSEMIHDATYIAQVEMEKIYILSTTLNDSENELLAERFNLGPYGTCLGNVSNDYKTSFTKTEDAEDIDKFSIETTICMLRDYPNAGKVIVKIKEKDTNLERAMMENVYIWK